jgi:hypothetical protein
MARDKRYYIVFREDKDEVTIFTTKADAARAVGCSDETLSRAMKRANHYCYRGVLVLFACGISKNVSRVIKGRRLIALSQG